MHCIYNGFEFSLQKVPLARPVLLMGNLWIGCDGCITRIVSISSISTSVSLYTDIYTF